MSQAQEAEVILPAEQFELMRSDIKPHWGDQDAIGHINSLSYLKYIQECRAQWLASIPLDWNHTLPVIVNLHAEYLLELNYPTPITVIMTGSDPGRSSFMSHYEIWGQDDNTLYTRAYSKMVWIDKQSRRSIPLPEVVLQQLR